MANNLVTTGQLGKSLGVTHTRVADIIRNAKDFPDPEIALPNGTRLWRKEVALKWFEEHPRRKYERRTEMASTNEAAST